MIDLNPDDLREVQRIMARHLPHGEVRVFGSRVTGQARPYSDLDLVVISPTSLDWFKLEALRDAFSESNLPFQVDVLDWSALSPEFQQLIDQSYEILVY